MTSPLVPFALTLAVAWGSLAAAGARYVHAVREAERARAAAEVPPTQPERPPEPPPPSPPPKKDDPVAVVTPQPPVVRPTPAPQPVFVPQPPASRLPDGVDWSAGDLLVLVAPSADANRVWVDFADQLANVREQAGRRLVGGDVFVSGRSRLWRWRDWAGGARARADEAAGADSVTDAFAQALKAVAADRQAVAGKRGVPFRTAVVWHSAYDPADLPAGVGEVPAAVLVWTGAEQQAQRANAALPRAFGRGGVYSLGPQVHDVAASVVGIPPAR